MANAHAIEGVEEDNDRLAAIVNEDFVQVPACHIAVDYHGVDVGCVAQINNSGVKG
jgi:hypothetical protein